MQFEIIINCTEETTLNFFIHIMYCFVLKLVLQFRIIVTTMCNLELLLIARDHVVILGLFHVTYEAEICQHSEAYRIYIYSGLI